MRTWSFIVFVIFAVAARDGMAQGTAEELAPPVELLVAMAVARAPEVAVAEARSSAARQREIPANALSDPMIGLTAQGMGVAPPGPSSSIVVDVSQALPYPGKREARQAAAEAETQVLVTEIADLKRRVAAEVRLAYARLYSLDREKEKRSSTHELLGLLSRTVASRYSTGGAARAALLRLSLESARVEERLIEIESERVGLVAALNRRLDRPLDTPLGRISGLPNLGPLGSALDESALQASLELAVLRAEEQAAKRRAEATRLEEHPDFVVGLGGGIDGMVQPVVMLRLGMALPLWRGSKQKPLTRAAEQELAASQGEIRVTEVDVRSRIAALRAAWRRDDALLALYSSVVVPQSRGVFEAAQAEYLAGRGDFSTVIEGFEGLLESEVAVARREASRFETWALLEQLTASSEPPQVEEEP